MADLETHRMNKTAPMDTQQTELSKGHQHALYRLCNQIKSNLARLRSHITVAPSKNSKIH